MALGAMAGAVGLARAVDNFFGSATVTIYQRLPFQSPHLAAGAAAGAMLVGWIVVQLAMIGIFSWLQPLCVGTGLLISYLAMTLPRRQVDLRGTAHR